MMGLLAALALVALNGFFVAAEFSMVRVRPAQLQRLEKKGVPGATSALKVARENRPLSLGLADRDHALLPRTRMDRRARVRVDRRARVVRDHAAGARRARARDRRGRRVRADHLPARARRRADPEAHRAASRAEQAALFLARPFRIAFVLLAPVRFLIEGATRIALRAFGLKGTIPGEGELSEEELTSIIAATMARGPGADDKRALLERVVRFASRQARHAMVPRVDLAYLPVATSGKDAIAYLRQQEYTRIVLTERNDIDRVAGYLYGKDLLLDPNADKLADLSSVRRDILYVPEPQSLIDVLRAMQQAQTLFALVVDEYGGTSGLLTMEDLLEEIVGEDPRRGRRGRAATPPRAARDDRHVGCRSAAPDRRAAEPERRAPGGRRGRGARRVDRGTARAHPASRRSRPSRAVRRRDPRRAASSRHARSPSSARARRSFRRPPRRSASSITTTTPDTTLPPGS